MGKPCACFVGIDDEANLGRHLPSWRRCREASHLVYIICAPGESLKSSLWNGRHHRCRYLIGVPWIPFGLSNDTSSDSSWFVIMMMGVKYKTCAAWHNSLPVLSLFSMSFSVCRVPHLVVVMVYFLVRDQ